MSVRWYLVKRFNLLEYFRDHIADYDGTFYVQHPAHFGDHSGMREAVTFVSYYPKDKEYVVKRILHKDGEKAILTNVRRHQLFMHAR